MMKTYSAKEIEILKSNPNVVSVKYGSQIEYKETFKIWAVVTKIKYPELSAREIFERAGFDNKIITSEKARMRLNHWNKVYAKKKTQSNVDHDKLDYRNNELLINLFYQMSRLVDILERR